MDTAKCGERVGFDSIVLFRFLGIAAIASTEREIIKNQKTLSWTSDILVSPNFRIKERVKIMNFEPLKEELKDSDHHSATCRQAVRK